MSFGFRLLGANGGVEYSETQTGTRLIKSVDIARNWSGVISVPEFDSNKGTLNVVVEAYDFVQHGQQRVWVNFSSHPTLVWNNGAKTLTVTAESSPFHSHLQVPDYRVGFFHNQ